MTVYGIALIVALGALYALFAYVVIEDFLWRRKQRKFAARIRTLDLTSPEGRDRLGLSQTRREQ